MKKAALYARVSTGLQEKERTIESQIAEIKKQIATNGDVLTKEYLDDGYSGAFLDRPALDQLRTELKTNLLDAVYFLSTDRIAREVTHQNIIISEILGHNKQLIIGGKDYAKNPENDFTLTVLGAASQLERAKIIERHTRGKLHRLRQGFIQSNGHNTFGYNYIPRTANDPARSEVNEQEAKIVRYIFKAYAEDNASWATIVRGLEDMGAKTKLGKRLWDTEKVRNILKNYTYTGTKYFNTRYHEKKSSNPIRAVKYGRKIYRDKSEWIPIKVPAIISQELFDKAQVRLEASRNVYRKPKEHRLLSNLITCGKCGRFFISYYRTYRDARRKGDPNTVFHKYAYRCSRITYQRIHSAKAGVDMTKCKNPEVLSKLLEACVFTMIQETMTNSGKLKKCMDLPRRKARTSQWRVENRLKEIERYISNLAEQRKSIIDLYASGTIDRPTYAERCQKHDNAISRAKTERSEIIKSIPALHKKDIVDVSIQQFCEAVKTRWAICKNYDLQRKFMLDFVEKIIYNNTNVTLIGSVPVKLKTYEDPDQPSEASKLEFRIEGQIKRGNKWTNRNI